MKTSTAAALLERYEAFALDAYGVLVDGDGPLPHAAAFVAALARGDKRRLLLSNDASRTPAQVAARLQGFGIDLGLDEILTSGMMIAPWVERHGLQGAAAIVLGPDASHTLSRDAGLDLVAPDDPAAEVVVVCDEAGFEFIPALESTITTLVRRHARGLHSHLALPNPDIIYPKAAGAIGLTAGAAATVIERALRARFGEEAPVFERLGKPHLPIFTEALGRLRAPSPSSVVMIGDQLETDVAGALGCGIDVALVETGVGRRPAADASLRPTWVLPDLA